MIAGPELGEREVAPEHVVILGQKDLRTPFGHDVHPIARRALREDRLARGNAALHQSPCELLQICRREALEERDLREEGKAIHRGNIATRSGAGKFSGRSLWVSILVARGGPPCQREGHEVRAKRFRVFRTCLGA